VTLYSLKKWAGLACKGNPTALHFLFAPSAITSGVWLKVLAHREVFLARTCLKQFLGFADDQLQRITGQKGRGQKGQRPEIEQQFGYDAKAAMHALRLLYECRELVSTGNLTLPRPERDLLIRVRTGKYDVDKVIEMSRGLVVECNEAAKNSPLSEEIDRHAVSNLVADCYQRAWQHSEE
jgi:hypothetical protein